MKVNGLPSELIAGEARLWRFGACEFDELRFQLRIHGVPVELERKPLEVLAELLAKGGAIARKDELLEKVWPGVLVVDASLATAVSKLRRALAGEDVIQTVSKVGYRICVPIRWDTIPEPATISGPRNLSALLDSVQRPAPGSPATPVASRRRRFLLTASVAGLLGAAAILLVVMHSRSRPAAAPITLAILPFQNAGADPSLEYLRAALPDQVAATLNAARSLTIRPLSAAAQFSGQAVNFREVARALDVNRIVTGHFIRAADQYQITMEAVDPDANRVLWRETVNVPANNLLSLQEQIAAMSRWRLARALGIADFVPEEPPRATNAEAYELYLKSTALEWGTEKNQQGIDLLRKAVQLDPNYAPAWGMLSLRYYTASRFVGGGPELLQFADAAAERELALDPDSPNPVAELNIHRTERGELVKAHEIALELLRRRPDNANNHHVLSYVLRYGGSLDESAHECDLTKLLAARYVWGACATTFMELGDYQKARSLLRADLSSEWSRARAIDVYLRAGNLQEALKVPAPRIPGWDSYSMALACARQAAESEVHAQAARVKPDDDPEQDYMFAGHLSYCRQTAGAFRMLRLAIDRNYCSYPAMDKDPLFDNIRHDPDFKKVRAAGIACHDAFIASRKRGPEREGNRSDIARRLP